MGPALIQEKDFELHTRLKDSKSFKASTDCQTCILLHNKHPYLKAV